MAELLIVLLLETTLLLSLHGHGVMGVNCYHLNETIRRDTDCKMLWNGVNGMSVGFLNLTPIHNACTEDRECYDHINSYISNCVPQEKKSNLRAFLTLGCKFEPVDEDRTCLFGYSEGTAIINRLFSDECADIETCTSSDNCYRHLLSGKSNYGCCFEDISQAYSDTSGDSQIGPSDLKALYKKCSIPDPGQCPSQVPDAANTMERCSIISLLILTLAILLVFS